MIVDLAVYDKGIRRRGDFPMDDALEAARESDETLVWIGLYEPSAEEFDAVRVEFGLHPLAVEDALESHQRSKLERYGETLFLVFKTAWYDDAAEAIEYSEIQLFAGEGFVITVRHGGAHDLRAVRQGLEGDPERLALGPVAVVHAILDRVVDDYLPVIDGLDQDIAEIEADVFSPDRSNPAVRIYKLKREVLDLYRNIEPLIDPLERLQTGKHPFNTGGIDLGPYFRDVNDHLRRGVVRVQIQRELLSEVLNVNLTQVSVQQNEDMRRISGWVAIAAVPTMLAGLWGMNFTYMPELDETWGYPMALALMVGGGLVLFRWLRSRRWI